MNISFSEAAATYIQTCINKERGLGFRLSIKKTGCSGFSYAPTVVTEVKATDQSLTLANGVKVYVDPVWLHLLDGIQVDFIAENKSGLMQKKLIFINPKETNRCGCGESFHIE